MLVKGSPVVTLTIFLLHSYFIRKLLYCDTLLVLKANCFFGNITTFWDVLITSFLRMNTPLYDIKMPLDASPFLHPQGLNEFMEVLKLSFHICPVPWRHTSIENLISPITKLLFQRLNQDTNKDATKVLLCWLCWLCCESDGDPCIPSTKS